MYEDAQAAIAEANKLVQSLDGDILKDTTSGLQTGSATDASEVLLRHSGWAGKKSIEELWGDVWSEKGELSVAKGLPYVARADFETALTHFPDHPGAIVGLSNILLDIYDETLLPPPAVPGLNLAPGPVSTSSASGSSAASTTIGAAPKHARQHDFTASFPPGPLGLRKDPLRNNERGTPADAASNTPHIPAPNQQLPPPYKAKSLPLNDRFAARDRAYGLLSGLTKL
jgi:hypothetical protein